MGMTRSPLQLAILSCLIGEYPEPVEYMRLTYGLMCCGFLPASLDLAILKMSQEIVALEDQGMVALISAWPDCVCALTQAAIAEVKEQLAAKGETFEAMQQAIREAAQVSAKAVTVH